MIIKKKIRIIIGSLDVGGTEKQLLEIINYLANKNWKVELITIKNRGLLAKYVNKKIIINNFNIKNEIKFFKFFKIINKLYKIFKKDPYTLTHFFLPQSYIMGMISSTIARAKCKMIMSRRSLNFYQKKFIFCRPIEKMLHKKVNKIIVNSEAIKKQLMHQENVSENKISLIYNGVKTKNIKKIKKLNKFNIIIIANLIPYKNHKMLFYSLSLIKEKLPKNWRLYCLGRDDGIKKNLIEFSKKIGIYKKIIWVETIKLENVLAKCDLGILCSNEEGLPNAILEYLSSKIPVITTDVGGCNEIIKNKKNGLVVKKNDHIKLSKAILDLYKNKKKAKKFANRGFVTVKNKFNLKKTLYKHENEYLNCLKP